MFKGILSTIGGWFDPVTDLIDELHTSQEEKAAAHARLAEIQLQLRVEAMKHMQSIAKTQADVVLGEINGKSAMQRNWRPALMFVCIVILANNFIVAPILDAVFGFSIQMVLPGELWNLMMIGIGGYIGARTYEKKTQTDAFMEQVKLTHGKDPNSDQPEVNSILDVDLLDDSTNLH